MDFPLGIQNTVKLFADDTKIYRELSNKDVDTSILQFDLNYTNSWTKTWQLNFNLEKCEVMRITHLKDPSLPEYYLSRRKLKKVDHFKDLSVIMLRNLTWAKQIEHVICKANRVLSLIKQMVGSSNINTFTALYKALVTPILEYAVPVWSPYFIKDIQAVETIQRRASRIALKQKRGEMSYPDRCSLLK